MKKIFLLLLIVLLLTPCAAKSAELSLVPAPREVSAGNGCFRLTPGASIGYSPELKAQADMLVDRIWTATGMNLDVARKWSKAAITLEIDTVAGKRPEGYSLEVSPRGVQVKGYDAAGVFYGIQTLLQLFPAEICSTAPVRNVDLSIPAVTVYDAPEHPWRGMMLDVSRYFFDKEFVKRFIDMMGMYKLNRLQLHMIDDSGWRLEIKKYPRLTEVGAWGGRDEKRLGGFYTQEEMKELVKYAADRNVEIVPEVEFPAHILSAIVAYPWLSCTGEQYEVPVQHFISRDLICAGKQSSLDFLEDVLDEVCAIFPSEYVNIGGDEAVYTRWESCPDCQALMKREGLSKASELQGYLTNKVADMLAARGRRAVGWEEIIMRGEVHRPVTGLIWHNPADSSRVSGTRHQVILCPASNTYLDFPESTIPGEPKAATWMPAISLEKCYTMPLNDYSASSAVLGLQGCLWSDQFIHGTLLQEIPAINENRSEAYMEYLGFPRMMAVAELGWTPQAHRDFTDFRRRLSGQYPRLEKAGIGYRVPQPVISDCRTSGEGFLISLEPCVDGAELRYTVDGSYPTVHSPLYTAPVEVPDKYAFKAITVVTPTHYSLPVSIPVDMSELTDKYGTLAAQWTTPKVNNGQYTFDASGKIISNGKYRITFLPTHDNDNIAFGPLQLFKRSDLIATATPAPTSPAPASSASASTSASTSTSTSTSSAPTSPASTTPSSNSSSPSSTLSSSSCFSYDIEVNDFEAGTPLTIKVTTIPAGPSEGYVFIAPLPQ